MSLNIKLLKSMSYISIVSMLIFSCNHTIVSINDTGGELGITNAPVSIKVELNSNQVLAAKEGRLILIDPTTQNPIPVQLENHNNDSNSKAVFIFPNGESKLHKFKMSQNNSTNDSRLVKAYLDSKTSQIIVEEGGKKVLQYNYQTVHEKDVIRNGNTKNKMIDYSNKMSGVYFEEYLKSHPEFPTDTIVSSAIYAVPRSDYIHPLYGLEGELLTDDWPDAAHPHHRGIFWSWPEVNYGTKRGDIYALQTVFARPTGKLNIMSGPVYAEINAENLWMWEDKEPIVRENSVIRAYRSTSNSRIIDLTIKLLALKDSVTIATRFTNSYGGLNIRMQPSESQDISYFTDKDNSDPVRAWSDLNGVFEGNKSTSGLMVLQHHENPEYPGVWKDYPGLYWVQPTFPTPNTRFLLSTKEPLTLQYRLIIHADGKPNQAISKAHWDAYHSTFSPN